MAKEFGFHAKNSNNDGLNSDYEGYLNRTISVVGNGSTSVGVLIKVEKDHLALLPSVVYEGLPGNTTLQRYRLEKETPSRVNLPISSICPQRPEYLEEIVEHSKREFEECMKKLKEEKEKTEGEK